jgi:hypothetical protein
MLTPRQKAFKADKPSDWKPCVGDTVFVRTGSGLRRITATACVIGGSLLDDCCEIRIVRVIGGCDIRKQMILPIDDLRPSAMEEKQVKA